MGEFLKKRIPTIIGILLLLAGGTVGVMLVGQGTGFLPRAGPEFAPNNLTMTNITDNSFTISWITDVKTEGYIQYGTSEKSLETTKRDDRDELTGSVGLYLTHHITIRGLEPSTTYYFRVGSGEGNQLYDNNGQPYEAVTALVLGTPPLADTAYGQVLTSAAIPAENAIVYIQMPSAVRLSTLVKESGQWAVSISTARSTDLSSYVLYDPQNTQVDILVQNGPDQKTMAVTTTGNDQPVPTMTLGTDYDFTDQQEPEPQESEEVVVIDEGVVEEITPTTEGGFDLSPLGEITPVVNELTIINPAEDEEAINTQTPEFYGTAPAGAVITITVESEHQVTDTVVVGDNNIWRWTTTENLDPGEHTITVSFTDGDGILQTLSRSFVVYAVGESELPAFVSTPSATPTPTPSPSPTPTTIPEIGATPEPTITPTPTPTMTPTPTTESSPSGRVSQPSTDSGVPVPGNASHTLTLIFMGILLVGAGYLIQRQFEI